MLRNAARPGVSRSTPTRDASSYVAKGNGLILAAPKQYASFLVSSSTGAKLRVRSQLKQAPPPAGSCDRPRKSSPHQC